MKYFNKKPERVIVIGASIAGLLSARVCSAFFEEVIILDQDKIPSKNATRKGVPQGDQIHLLLSKGLSILSDLFPGIQQILKEKGANIGDIGEKLKWYAEGGFRPRCKVGLETVMMSRPLLENTVREELLQNPNIKLKDEEKVITFNTQDGKVTGIVSDKATYKTDLVIDARGFVSRLHAELELMGFEIPPIENVQVNVKYASCIFPKSENLDSLLNINTKPPYNSKHGSLQPIEGGKMMATVQGRLNDEIPNDLASFKEYTLLLENHEMYEIIKDLEADSKVFGYKVPFVRWIHYEKLDKFPEGLLPLGDAICRLNPVYGQGMTSASIQANILYQLLKKKGHRNIWKLYFKKVAKEIKSPWEISIAEDFKFPETQGIPPKIPVFLIKYFDKLNRVMNQDPVIYKSFVKVLNMVSSPKILLNPQILWRVIKAK